jgi:hypothetical protein
MITTITHQVNPLRSTFRLLIAGLLCMALSAFIAPIVASAQASPTMLWGYVMNYKGEFVPGATVTLYSLPEHVAVGPVAVSDAQGVWSMESGSGTFAVEATAPGYGRAAQTVYATSTQTGITFILRQLAPISSEPLVATMSGRVSSQDGVPLGGINIIANDRAVTGVKQAPQASALNATVTAVDGTYSLSVPAGQIWLKVQSGSAWGYQLKPVNVSAGDVITGADFVVAVRVLGRSNFPAPTAVPTPISDVRPGIGVGMPQTGQGDADYSWLALAALGCITAVTGGVLTLRSRAAKQ